VSGPPLKPARPVADLMRGVERRMRAITAAAVLCAFALLPRPAHAGDEIWVWTTPDGVVHYTDDREQVPEAFREGARVAQRQGSGSYQRVATPSAGSAPVAPAADLGADAEAAWRGEANALDARIAALAPQAEACATDHVRQDPGDGSRARREEREEAARCARVREELAAALAAREALEERAHREGIPPGWVRAED
jgi:hypothetical protein